MHATYMLGEYTCQECLYIKQRMLCKACSKSYFCRGMVCGASYDAPQIGQTNNMLQNFLKAVRGHFCSSMHCICFLIFFAVMVAI